MFDQLFRFHSFLQINLQVHHAVRILSCSNQKHLVLIRLFVSVPQLLLLLLLLPLQLDHSLKHPSYEYHFVYFQTPQKDLLNYQPYHIFNRSPYYIPLHFYQLTIIP